LARPAPVLDDASADGPAELVLIVGRRSAVFQIAEWIARVEEGIADELVRRPVKVVGAVIWKLH
jgi:hypothetical protein